MVARLTQNASVQVVLVLPVDLERYALPSSLKLRVTGSDDGGGVLPPESPPLAALASNNGLAEPIPITQTLLQRGLQAAASATQTGLKPEQLSSPQFQLQCWRAIHLLHWPVGRKELPIQE